MADRHPRSASVCAAAGIAQQSDAKAAATVANGRRATTRSRPSVSIKRCLAIVNLPYSKVRRRRPDRRRRRAPVRKKCRVSPGTLCTPSARALARDFCSFARRGPRGSPRIRFRQRPAGSAGERPSLDATAGAFGGHGPQAQMRPSSRQVWPAGQSPPHRGKLATHGNGGSRVVVVVVDPKAGQLAPLGGSNRTFGSL